METDCRPKPHLTTAGLQPGHFAIERRTYAAESVLTRAELQAIVQEAYDAHGIVAQLWTDTANDTPQTSCNGTDHCPASASHHFDCQAVNA